MFLVNWFYGILNSLGLAMKSGKSGCCSDAVVSALRMMTGDGVRFTRGLVPVSQSCSWCAMEGAERYGRIAHGCAPECDRVLDLFLSVSMMFPTIHAGT